MIQAGKSQKYGNTTYAVRSVVGLNDRLCGALLENMIHMGAPYNLIHSGLVGDWHHFSVDCKIEKLDGPGEWVSSEWKFSPITYTSDFPFDLIKKDN